MLGFERLADAGDDEVLFEAQALVLAGWTGREEAHVRAHIEELAALGVKPPSAIPLFYRVTAQLASQADRLEVLGADTSGEVEYVIVAMEDGLWVTAGSDQTDRKAEALGVALSKQLCGKVLGRSLWRLEELKGHWDQLVLRAYALIDGERVLYQEGTLAALRRPEDLIARYTASGNLHAGTLLMSGTLSAIGGIRPAARFDFELEDPVRGRAIRHGYDVAVLPVVA